jgi:hypothetical protein
MKLSATQKITSLSSSKTFETKVPSQLPSYNQSDCTTKSQFQKRLLGRNNEKV